MIIAISGATGSIGVELIKTILADEKNEVIALCRPNSVNIGKLPVDSRLKIVYSDLSQYKLLPVEKCDIFYHLAWNGTFGLDRDDVEMQKSNIDYSIEAVNLAHKWGAKRFIGIGSQAEYGPTSTTMGEYTPVNPITGYGIAKYAAGKFCNIKCNQLNIDYCWVRVLSVFGPNDPPHTLIYYLFESLNSGISPILTKCDQQWDYIYVKDAARALLLIGLKGVNNRTYCLGSGTPRPLKEYVMAARDVINPNVEIKFGSRPYYPNQVMNMAADITTLNKDTGFCPIYSFEEGIREMVSIYLSQIKH